MANNTLEVDSNRGKPSCSTCRFNDVGICRRYPPQMMLYPTDNQHPILYDMGQSQPYVVDGDWCGEYVERDS